MRTTLTLILGLSLLGLIVMAVIWRRDTSTRLASEAKLAKDLHGLKKDLQVLRNKQPAVQRVYTLRSDSANDPPAAPDEQEAEASADPVEDSEQLQKERAREVVTGLEARLAGEAIDGEWSAITLRQIRESISSGAPGSRLLKAECASTLCRVELSHDTEEDRKRLGLQIASLEPFGEGVFYDYESDPAQTTLFVIRPGHSFRQALAAP